MNKSILLIAVLISLVNFNEAANILGLFPMPGKSHYVMFQRIFLELAARGHNVDVVTHFPIKNPPPRFNQLSVEGSMHIFVNNVSVDTLPAMTTLEMLGMITKDVGSDMCAEVFKTSVFQELKTTKKTYDLVVTEIFGTDCMLGFGHLYQVPTVSMISSAALPWANDRVGNPDNPSYIPNYFNYDTHKMDLFGRLKNTLLLAIGKISYALSVKESNRFAREFFGPDLPDLDDLSRNTSLILVNSYFIGNQARPTVPNFIEVGGVHIKKPKPLPKHLDEVIQIDSNRTKGVILLTMGSMILTESFPIETLQGMFDAFAGLPYKVIWKASKKRFPEGLRFPKNIHFETWLPQLDILCHPNVKLFVSHGGLMGTQEAMYCGVPRIGIPFFADQVGNIRTAAELGLAIKVDYEKINKQSILDAATKLLTDPQYERNAKRVAALFNDRPLSALDEAIFWIEYVIKYKGAPELRSPGADLPFYQYYLIDVGLILLLLTIIIAISVVVLTKLLIKIVISNASKQKSD